MVLMVAILVPALVTGSIAEKLRRPKEAVIGTLCLVGCWVRLSLPARFCYDRGYGRES